MGPAGLKLLFPAVYSRGIEDFIAVAAATEDDRFDRFSTRTDTGEYVQFVAQRLCNAAASAAKYPAGELDRRPVGIDAAGDIVWVYELWDIAVGQFIHEIESRRQNWLYVVKRIAEAEDARQCADGLGIKPTSTHEESIAEMERVGLGGLIDAANDARRTIRFGTRGAA